MKVGTDFPSYLFGGKITKYLNDFGFTLYNKKTNPPNRKILPIIDESAVCQTSVSSSTRMKTRRPIQSANGEEQEKEEHHHHHQQQQIKEKQTQMLSLLACLQHG